MNIRSSGLPLHRHLIWKCIESSYLGKYLLYYKVENNTYEWQKQSSIDHPVPNTKVKSWWMASRFSLFHMVLFLLAIDFHKASSSSMLSSYLASLTLVLFSLVIKKYYNICYEKSDKEDAYMICIWNVSITNLHGGQHYWVNMECLQKFHK